MTISPDADLIATCHRHIANIGAYDTSPGDLPADDNPAWRA